MLRSFLPSTIQGLPSVFDSDEIFDKQTDCENITIEKSIEDSVNEFQTADTYTDQSEWVEGAFSFKQIENDESTNKKRACLESITNTVDKYSKKTKILDDHIIAKAALVSKDKENDTPSIIKKQLPSETISVSSEKNFHKRKMF